MAKGSMNEKGRAKLGQKADRVINSGQQPTMGPGFMRPDVPSATEFRAGMLEPKKGAVPDPLGVMAPATPRKRVMAQSALGARYRITPNVNAVVQPEPTTQRNLRTVPSVMGSRPNFKSY
jgi:hypothetical protein